MNSLSSGSNASGNPARVVVPSPRVGSGAVALGTLLATSACTKRLPRSPLGTDWPGTQLGGGEDVHYRGVGPFLVYEHSRRGSSADRGNVSPREYIPGRVL